MSNIIVRYFVFSQILVHGSAEATRSLREYLCRVFGIPLTKTDPFVGTFAEGAGATIRVHAPQVGELIDATKEGHILQVHIFIYFFSNTSHEKIAHNH